MFGEMWRGVTGLVEPALFVGLGVGMAGALLWVIRAKVPFGLVLGTAAAIALESAPLFLVVLAVVLIEWKAWPAVVAVPAVAALAVASRTPSAALVACLLLAALAAGRAGPRIKPAHYVVSALGWYAGLPDTEAALAVLGAAVPALVARPKVGRASAYAVGAAVVAVGAAARTGAVLGGILSFGSALVPLPLPFHVVVVAFSSRVIGTERDPARAIVLTVITSGLLLLVHTRVRPMPERTRVLHLVKGLGPGGAERLLVELLTVADRTTCEHRVAYALAHKAHLVPQLTALGVDVACLGPRWPLRLRARLAQADIAHAHSPLLAAAARVVARTLPTRSRPATVATEHNSWRAYKAPTRLANALTYPLDARHLAVSDDARRSVWRPFRRRTEVVVHGIDLPATAAHRHARDTTRQALGLGHGDIAVVTVANYRPEKDHATLLRAAVRLRHHPHVRFLVVGQGPLADDVARLHRDLGLAPTVTLLGYRPDALDVLAAADVFALSSAHEGLPVALMEALALGVPVVATAVGGIPEAVTHGVEGLLVPPGDDTALAAAVTELATDEARRRTMGHAALARSLAFDVHLAARRLDALYAEVARR